MKSAARILIVGSQIKNFALEYIYLNCAFLAQLHEVHRAIVVTPVVHVPVLVRVTLWVYFSRSPYLDNHLSENIHTWTIHTL